MLRSVQKSKGNAKEVVSLMPKHESEAAGMGRGQRGPEVVQRMIVKALRRQKCDFQSSGGLNIGYKDEGQNSRNRKRRGPGLRPWGRTWVVELQA